MPGPQGKKSGIGRVALVTGAARGNGLAIAEALAGAAHIVYLADIASQIREVPYALATPAELEQAAEALRESGAEAHAARCDVRDGAAVAALVQKIERDQGRLDILVNNAGVLVLHPLEQVSEAEWDLHLDVIAKGTFHASRASLPGMTRRGWGRIVNVASVAGERGLGTATAYTAAKHAVLGFTRALAMEVAKQGITVNAVCPGTVPTPLVHETGRILGLSPQDTIAQFSQRHLTQTPITPQDVAQAVLWLASDAAARINGAALFVDDGWHCH